ncbi:DEAD/DEAH box helicase [Paraburkholderia caballeronis]|uniref:Replicative superfamily II helicase n=1 Tax=Paraburkholderia caballeronis TaxID=416943 RepID=A0A1H7LA76_9BURK|nr:DEAD/DEAH box helicase [Paraburkholderia caballeronis]PXW28350.1 replicative superfamily II helicase [Paraburkholderia caballeronis]PXX03716.1 replicative superfamily II helicase [Paraburkholderia caballeronis]RAK04460.1 replicative superfamily II helicase [Paraburkholderia caballeronis]SED79259.1 Replicative superfamily II helicase [Paraburkholderia caballeronis]SEK95415.1 Replicative superfamily II helicase [Paraburkholderia caballeronis]
MTLKGIFVGVNRQLDPNIDELTGAVRDATALNALFLDSIPGFSAKLLVDENATRDNVSEAIFGTLANAADDDVIVISFAGHGSPDGGIAVYDTLCTDLAGTTLSMASIGDAFKATRARAVLCILDCCFSGHAPARVLEVPAQPRSVFALEGVAGEGRILLTACTARQVAWEQPGTGHGLLTYAVIQAMTATTVERISFPGVGDEIVQIARVEAERIGATQTPVFLGNVQGGLVFPRLVPGANYHAAFPSTTVEQMAGPFEQLLDNGFPQSIVDQWSARFPDGLNALQLRAVNEYGVLAGRSLMTVAPTSSGKTMIGELSAIQSVIAGKKAVFLLPYRAIVSEKFEEFSERYGPSGLRIVRCMGDATDTIGEVLAGRYDLGFFTYEMFLNLALGAPHILNRIGLVTVDEAQFITDPRRGITVELILALLLRARTRGVHPQLIVLSAVIGRLNGFDQWLDIPVLLSRDRPVPLVEGVLDRNGVFQYRDVDGMTKTDALLPPHSIRVRKAKPSSQDVIVPLAQKLVGAGEKLIVFRNQRGKAQGCARYLSGELGKGAATATLDALPSQDLTSASHDLHECLRGGTAFHSTNLLRAEREAIERGFRDTKGGIWVLGSTTTLAAGINTPASTVILAEQEFRGEDGRPFSIAEYKNMAGRAGRLGFNEIGKAIILAETPVERARLFQRYVEGTPEDVVSSFAESAMPTWVLRLLSQVHGVKLVEIPGLLVNTFGGYAAARANPNWVAVVQPRVAAFVDRLLQAGLAEKEGDDIVHLTMLGQAVGSSSLSFESGLRLVELLCSVDIATTPPLHILAHVQVLQEMSDVYTPLMTRGRAESARINDVIVRFGPAMSRLLQRYGADEHTFWRRCKRAAILFDWVEGVPVDSLERSYTANPFTAIRYGDIVSIADATRFHLRSAQRILSALFPEHQQFLDAVDVLLTRLEFGVPERALPLRKLCAPLNRGQCLALLQEGGQTPEAVSAMNDAQLLACVGQSTFQRLRPQSEVVDA